MVIVSTVALAACGSSSRNAASPHSKTTTTAATISKPTGVVPRVERLVVAAPGSMAMVGRDGCVASVKTSEIATGTHDELRVRCPKPERIRAWFEGVDRVMSTFAFDPIAQQVDDDEEEITLPAAKVITASGKMMRIAKKADVERLTHEVNALSAELASAEEPAPGPASQAGWQMLHVSGPAHVLFAGTPARGVFEARVSTNGQYLCEFIMSSGDGPIHTTKSGWIAPTTASKAIDVVLAPFSAPSANERPKPTFAAGITNGSERRTNVSSTAAIFTRFAQMQDALGDACLPELEPPAAPQIGL